MCHILSKYVFVYVHKNKIFLIISKLSDNNWSANKNKIFGYKILEFFFNFHLWTFSFIQSYFCLLFFQSKKLSVKMVSFELNGVFVPVPTCFDQSGNLDLDNFAKTIQETNKYEFKGEILAFFIFYSKITFHHIKILTWQTSLFSKLKNANFHNQFTFKSLNLFISLHYNCELVYTQDCKTSELSIV